MLLVCGVAAPRSFRLNLQSFAWSRQFRAMGKPSLRRVGHISDDQIHDGPAFVEIPETPTAKKSRIGEPAGDEAQNISSPMSDRQTLRFQEPAAHGLLDDSFAPSPTDSDRALTWPVSPSLTPAMSEDQSRTAALAEPDNGSKEPNLVFVKKELVFAALEVESTATPGSASADDAGHVQFDDMASLFSGHDASAPAAEHDDGPPPSESRREYDDVASVSSALALDPASALH